MTETPESIVAGLLPLVRGFCAGPCGIAVGGSHAKGGGDAHSDVDIYLFADAVLPAAERDAAVARALGPAARPASWGADEPFVQGGTDFLHRGQRIEVWLRSAGQVEDAIRASLRGEVRREPAVWAVMGFFGHVALADVQSMRIVEDPGGMLARWKDEVRAYPEPLRRAILRRFTAEAAFWPGNPHYHSAVERGDAIYASAIVQQVAQALIQVIFALNRVYFPGEKKLAEAMDGLPVQPPDFAARLQALLFPACEPGVPALRDQQRELTALLDEMKQLVSA